MPETTTDKHADLRRLKDELEHEKALISARSHSIRAKREAIREKMREMELQDRAMTQEIKAIEEPRLFDLDMQISALARGMGARTMSRSEV